MLFTYKATEHYFQICYCRNKKGLCKIKTYLSVAYCVTNNPLTMEHSRIRNKCMFDPAKNNGSATIWFDDC